MPYAALAAPWLIRAMSAGSEHRFRNRCRLGLAVFSPLVMLSI